MPVTTTPPPRNGSATGRGDSLSTVTRRLIVPAGSNGVGDDGLMDTLLGTPALSERRQVFLWGAIVEAVEAVPAPAIAVVSVIGRLDLASAPDVQRYLSATMAAGRRHLVLDLGGTTFVDSAG